MPYPWHLLRWPLRRRLRRIRRDSKVTAAEMRAVLYLFAGTYGDFVQILRPLKILAAAAPQAKILLLAPNDLFRSFRSFLPAAVERIGYLPAMLRCLRGVDIVFTNAIGVYRARFEVLACLGGRIALGFRYPEEKQRRAYSATLPLTPALRSFDSANLALLRLAGISVTESPKVGRSSPMQPGILFHVGSAGFKQNLGPDRYLKLVQEVLALVENRVEEILYGPGDEDIIRKLQSRSTSFRFSYYSLENLANRVHEYPGSVLCFNSFFAHFCRYLGKPAFVIHWEKIPYGYDCDPPHVQIVLTEKSGLENLHSAMTFPD